MTADYEYVFVKESVFQKFSKDISEYNTTIIPVSDFDEQELSVNEREYLPGFFSDICWIRDDFLSNEDIEFDYDAFEVIDDGVDYINPDHFSVNEIISYIR